MQFVEAHGARIPQIGLGTMTLKGDVCVQAVKTALQIGYRHLDTAAFYGNEKENGEGMRAVRRQARGRVHHHQSAPGRPDAGEIRAKSSTRASPICNCLTSICC